MNRRLPAVLAVLAALILGGCASSAEHTNDAAGQPPTSDLMTMADGTVMARDAMAATTPTSGALRPSAATAMVCGAETHASIAEVLKLSTKPTSTSSWTGGLYTCTYRLPEGTLVVSAKQSATADAARHYFAAQRARLAPTENLYGLGTSAYGNRAGIVALVKDEDTLIVDASRLPAVLGIERNKRFDFAYELASDILGCWTGD